METNSGSDESALEYSWKYNPPMNPTVGERNLKEVKQVLDQLKVVFLLGSGSCLGAVRDNAFIPWDDDIDLVSVIGFNGLTEESVDATAAALRDRGYFVSEMDGPYAKARMTITPMGNPRLIRYAVTMLTRAAALAKETSSSPTATTQVSPRTRMA